MIALNARVMHNSTGQVGRVVEVLSNGYIFQSDTGARFTVMSDELSEESDMRLSRAS